jgi:hypothetical protein
VRKKFFDDRIFYCPATNLIWIGRPDTKTQGQPWQWFIRNENIVMRPFKVPTGFIEIDRVPEYSIC